MKGKRSRGSPRKHITTTLDQIPDELEEEPSIEDSARPLLVNIEISTDKMPKSKGKITPQAAVQKLSHES